MADSCPESVSTFSATQLDPCELVLQSLLAAAESGWLSQQSYCWIFRKAADLSWDRSCFLRQLGQNERFANVVKLCKVHLEQCPATEKPHCAINTITFLAELTESQNVTDGNLWIALNSCLETLNEDKTDQLGIMISSLSNKQARSPLWDRVLQQLQSRMEANWGVAFGSESPRSDGTCCSAEGFNAEPPAETAGCWQSSPEHLVSMVNGVSEASSGNSVPCCDTSCEPLQERPRASSFGCSTFSALSPGSLFHFSPPEFSPHGASFESKEEPILPDFLTVAGQSRLQKWTESALLNAPPKTQTENWQNACTELRLAQAENERLKQQVQEVRKNRAQQDAQKRTLNKQRTFMHQSVQTLVDMNAQLNDRHQTLTDQFSEEMSRIKLQAERCQEAHSTAIRHKILQQCFPAHQHIRTMLFASWIRGAPALDTWKPMLDAVVAAS
jgi:hypothetical protein